MVPSAIQLFRLGICEWRVDRNRGELLEKIPSSNVDESDAFLNISGIKGESTTDAKHKDGSLLNPIVGG